jgi:hypothetical protein
VRCKTCHYSLQKLTEHRCPECGDPFDPNDPSTFDVPKNVWTFGWRRCAVTGIASYLAAFALIWLAVVHVLPSLSHREVRPVDVALSALFVWPFIDVLTLRLFDAVIRWHRTGGVTRNKHKF